MGRKTKKYFFTYKITCIVNGKYYYGMHSTNNLNDGYMGSGKRIKRSKIKYGEENHKREILEFVDNKKLLKVAERKLITKEELSKFECINIQPGGGGGFSSEEHERKFKLAACRHRPNWSEKSKLTRKKFTTNAKWREKVSQTIKSGIANSDYVFGSHSKGKKHSEETKKKMRESAIGKHNGYNNGMYGRCWITNEHESKLIYKGNLIPDGWRLGRVIK